MQYKVKQCLVRISRNEESRDTAADGDAQIQRQCTEHED